MPREVTVYRCQVDGRLTLLESQTSLKAHEEHPCRPVWPRWWERLALYLGWRP